MIKGHKITKSEYFHSASIMVEKDMDYCVSYVRKAENLSHWLIDQPTISRYLGNIHRIVEPDMGYVRVVPHGEDATYYHVGTAPDQLQGRIMISIDQYADIKSAHEPSLSCCVNLVAWRIEGMNEQRWQETCRRHEQEIGMLKSALERG